jgi:ABC-type lipoprotein release transport system permease subunit
MNLTFKVAFRNLFRQKRRTILLGIGIAFSMMVLFIVDALVGGISDKILNLIIVNQFGHMQVNMVERTDRRVEMIRDKAEVTSIISNTFPGMRFHIRENASLFVRAVGNGAGEMAVVIGSPTNGFGEYLKTLNTVAGNVDDWINGTVENPIVIYSGKAETMGVQVNDTIRIRMDTVYGQAQTARMTVVAIIKSENQYMDMMFWARLDDVKRLADIQPYEAQNLIVVFDKLKNPMLTLTMADRLHDAMIPHTLWIDGEFAAGSRRVPAELYGFTTNVTSMSNLASATGIPFAAFDKLTNGSRGIFIGSGLASAIGAGVGSTVNFGYDTRFEGNYDAVNRVAGVISSPEFANTAIVLDYDLYKFCFSHYPAVYTNAPSLFAYSNSLAQNWHLMQRTTTTKDSAKSGRSGTVLIGTADGRTC